MHGFTVLGFSFGFSLNSQFSETKQSQAVYLTTPYLDSSDCFDLVCNLRLVIQEFGGDQSHPKGEIQ